MPENRKIRGKTVRYSRKGTSIKARLRLVAGIGLSVLAFEAVAQQPQDGVLQSCTARGNSQDICICASIMLHARLGDQQYARFSDISNQIAALDTGADAEALDTLTKEGFKYFLPHGQAISVCRAKLAAQD
jgi:hypothetical protein